MSLSPKSGSEASSTKQTADEAQTKKIRAHPTQHRVRPGPLMERGAFHTKSNEEEALI